MATTPVKTKAAEESNGVSRARSLLSGILAIGFIALLFSASYYFLVRASQTPTSSEDTKPSPAITQPVRVKDSEGILLAAASLALLVFTAFAAVVGIFGWKEVQEYIRTRVLAEVRGDLEEYKNQLRGRSASILGHIQGELSLEKPSFKVLHPDLLEQAVDNCREGFRFLKESKGGPRLMALNNYLYYLAILGRRIPGDQFLRLAEELLAVGQEYKVSRLQLTYCRFVATYSSDGNQKAIAAMIVEDLILGKVIDKHEHEEARHCLRLLKSRQC